MVPAASSEPTEKPMKMADRAHANLPNKKPPWWSTQQYGLPMNYGQKVAKPTPGGRKLQSVADLQPTDTTLARSAPGIPDLKKKKERELEMLELERKVSPNRLVELEKQLRDEVARHTPYHERKTTILVRAFQTFDHERKGTLPLDAFRRALQCFGVEMTAAEGRALFRKFGQDGQRRLPYQVFTRALFTTRSRLLAWTHTHHMNTRGQNGLPKGSPFVADANAKQKLVDRLFDAKIQPLSGGGGHSITGIYPPSNWATDTWEDNGLVHPIVRARLPPDAEVELEHVYGYNGISAYDILSLPKTGPTQVRIARRHALRKCPVGGASCACVAARGCIPSHCTHGVGAGARLRATRPRTSSVRHRHPTASPVLPTDHRPHPIGRLAQPLLHVHEGRGLLHRGAGHRPRLGGGRLGRSPIGQPAVLPGAHRKGGRKRHGLAPGARACRMLDAQRSVLASIAGRVGRRAARAPSPLPAPLIHPPRHASPAHGPHRTRALDHRRVCALSARAQILCLKVDESRNYCATGQAPSPRREPGQMTDPFVCVWDLHSMQELMQLPHEPAKPANPKEKPDPVGGIQAVCFSEDGSLIISCGLDTKSTVFVWDWRQKKLVARKATKGGVPPQVYGVKWNREERADGTKQFDFATFGNKHINFWLEETDVSDTAFPRGWKFEPGSFMNIQDPGGGGKDAIRVQDVMCVEFLSNGSVVTGMASGDIYMWKAIDPTKPGLQCFKKLMIPGADPTQPAVKPHLHTVQVLKLRFVAIEGKKDTVPTLLSGGGGGKIKIWKDLDGEVPIFAHEIELPKDVGQRAKVPPSAPPGGRFAQGQPPSVKALDCFPGFEDLVVGTDKCDVYKINIVAKADGSYGPAVPTLLVKGHVDDVNGLDVHPTREYLFASVSFSEKIYLWDAKLKSLVGKASLRGKAGSCLAFRGDAKHIAVGTVTGEVFVFRELNDWEGDSLRLQKVPEMGIWPLRHCVSEIRELKYSPDLRTLASASRDTFIDLYDCSDGRYTRLHRCKGHSATVSHIDWELNSRVLQSQSNDYEVLFWNTDRGDPEEGWEVGQPSPFTDPRKRQKYGLQITQDQRDAEFATWSTNFGFPVMGIWPDEPAFLNPEISMVQRSPRLPSNGDNPKQLLAAVNHRHQLMVFNYPTVVHQQPTHYHPGHSSHVSNVRWMKYRDEEGVDQLIIITAGGHDRSLMQWRVTKLDPPKADDPSLRGSEQLLLDAKKAWYYKCTGSEWSGEDAIYQKMENIYLGLVGPKAPGAQQQLEGGDANAALEGQQRGSGGGGAKKAAGGSSGDSQLASASAVELNAKIKAQEAEITKQKQLIDKLQAQLASS